MKTTKTNKRKKVKENSEKNLGNIIQQLGQAPSKMCP